MNEKFKIQRENLNDKVERALRKMLVEEKWKALERLPSETELAELFGVNRLTVRMALQKLNAQGLVEVRPGDGIYAKKFSIKTYLESASDLFITPEMLDDVCEFRSVLEIESIRLAIERATPKDFEEMRKSCGYYLSLQQNRDLNRDEDLRRYVEADLDFHYSVCRSSHNSLYMLSFNACRGAFFRYMKKVTCERLQNGQTITAGSGEKDLHVMLLERIRLKDFAGARQLFEIMVDYKITGTAFNRISEQLQIDVTGMSEK